MLVRKRTTKMKRMRFFLINGERKSPADKSCPRVQCSGFSFARGFESPFEAWLRARSASYQRIGMTVYPSSFFLCDICPIKSTKKVLKKMFSFLFYLAYWNCQQKRRADMWPWNAARYDGKTVQGWHYENGYIQPHRGIFCNMAFGFTNSHAKKIYKTKI